MLFTQSENIDRCTAMSVWNVFKDRIAFRHHNCVACRKRVQRYGIFLNYQTFWEDFFKEFFEENSKQLKNRELNIKFFFAFSIKNHRVNKSNIYHSGSTHKIFKKHQIIS